MKYEIIPVTAFAQNCSLIWCDKENIGVLVDPGGDIEKIKKRVNELGIKIDKILLTHGHLDHVGSAKKLADYYQAEIFGSNEEDEFLFDNLPLQAQMFGLPDCASFRPNHWLKDGDKIEFGSEQLNVMQTPGHTPGHVIFYNLQNKIAFVGDLIFYRSVGRSDFPRGDHQKLIESIHRVLTLGDDILFIPGHGQTSTFGDEVKFNPFLN